MHFGRTANPWLMGILLLLPLAAAGGWVDPFGDWHPHEIRWNRAFQSIGDVSLWMRGISALGPGWGMWVMIGALFFGRYPRLGARVAVFVLGVIWFREVLAMSLQSPRPYWMDDSLRTFGDVATKRSTYGLPSGHALIGTAFWVYLAAEVKRVWAWVGAVGLALAICASRIYLGVHFVSDVCLGAVLGTVLALGYRAAEARWTGRVLGMEVRHRLMLAAGVGLGMVAVGWFVRAWVLTVPVPDAWLKYGTEARRAGMVALVGGSMTGVCFGLILGGQRLWKTLEKLRIAARLKD
jgi:membrane-associated phospholipid phosphatase